ncbi:redoxin domain-containing protein [Rhodopirellula sp. JC740]|uniref:Redoxin domain-containing protein n=1 Tax=Rhodopirellula halodulae TaxID=2894198 RepID=A0ABS8NEG9_9BACT|nr:redoxin domain-containing protein [Rhodopirellula sp. JC740]MCC9641317.1 redoxin domain-containing protein [Rhodopirellula sp. JC740]
MSARSLWMMTFWVLAFGTTVGLPGDVSTVNAAEDTETPAQPYVLQMIRDDSVHAELQLSTEQVDQVYEALAEVDPRWWVNRIAPQPQQQNEIRELTSLLKQRLSGVLNADQMKRLNQLEKQAAGTRFVVLPDAAETLGLSETQVTRLKETFAKTDEEVAKLQKQVASKEIEASDAAKDVAAIQSRERQSLVSQLSRDQQVKVGSMLGKTFDFSKVKRTYPRAPEFVLEGAQWIQGEPVRMEDLRGKVVAVYFYAFQCINCQRNFPHYEGWHQDLADEGLVVIGIQTPETSAERSLDRVTEAAKKDGFEYRVLFDEKSGNWRSWGNTMWPTTYLIDKDGFIRRWWQGEMNWQGTPGEQQMRETIQQLLTE